MKYRFTFLPIIVMLFFSMVAIAQEETEETMELEDSTYLKKKNYNEQYEYEHYTTAFPPKKKSMWIIGLQGGVATIAGDVSPNIGWGAGLIVSKSLGYLFSIRMQGLYAKTSGQDWKATRVAGQPKHYKNYETDFGEVNLQGVFHINNIRYHRKQTAVGFSIFAGLGFTTTTTKGDLLDENGVAYDYSGVTDATTGAMFPADGEVGRGDVKDELDALQDGEYETDLVRQKTDPEIFGRTLHPSYLAGLGIHFRVSKRIDINIEHRVSFHSDDLLDGTNAAIKNGIEVLSQGSDIMHYGTVGIGFKIGNREEPLQWINPLYTPYDDIRELKKTLDEGNLFADEDEDGVVNVLDLEQNTPPRVAVTTHGTTLDSDKDGVPDYLDKELFTVAGATIDADGVALDSDQDGVADVFDKEANTPAGSLVDANGIGIKLEPAGDQFNAVYFDFNSSTVKKEFYPALHKVAAYMESNPNAKIEVIGNTDNRGSEGYNNTLGERRAKKVVDVLKSSFGLPENRFVIVSKGASNAMVPNLPNSFNSKYENAHYLNRRVEFKVK